MTTRPVRIEVNCETGKETIVELTDEEIEANRQWQLRYEAQEAERLAKAQAKAEAKASALAKLAALGLTEAEANAIAGL